MATIPNYVKKKHNNNLSQHMGNTLTKALSLNFCSIANNILGNAMDILVNPHLYI